MSNRMTLIFSFIIIGCIAVLFLAQYLPLIWAVENEPFISHNGTRGIAVEERGNLWTLGFEQQNAFIDALNSGEEVPKSVLPDSSLFPFTRVIVYQFNNKPDLVFYPANLEGETILFQAPKLLKDGYIREGSKGQLLQMLNQSYDQ